MLIYSFGVKKVDLQLALGATRYDNKVCWSVVANLLDYSVMERQTAASVEALDQKKHQKSSGKWPETELKLLRSVTTSSKAELKFSALGKQKDIGVG